MKIRKPFYRSPWFFVLATGAIVLAGALGTKMYRNYHMVCGDIGRALTDEEFINIAIERVLQDQTSRLTRQTTDPDYVLGAPVYDLLPKGVTSPVKIYESVAEFRQLNPGCCARDQKYYDQDLMMDLIAGRPSVVDLSYRRYIAGPKPFGSATIGLTLCGRVGDRFISHSDEHYSRYQN